MSVIDLIVLGILMERPQSAYDIQKDVNGHHFSRWVKVSVPSIYKKALQLSKQGYLQGKPAKEGKFAEKTVYSITETGKAYFEQLMDAYSRRHVPLLFDFNVVITNLNKLEREKALRLVGNLRASITASAQSNEEFSAQYPDIPQVGRAVFDQQRLLYGALLEWLDAFEAQFPPES